MEPAEEHVVESLDAVEHVSYTEQADQADDANEPEVWQVSGQVTLEDAELQQLTTKASEPNKFLLALQKFGTEFIKDVWAIVRALFSKSPLATFDQNLKALNTILFLIIASVLQAWNGAFLLRWSAVGESLKAMPEGAELPYPTGRTFLSLFALVFGMFVLSWVLVMIVSLIKKLPGKKTLHDVQLVMFASAPASVLAVVSLILTSLVYELALAISLCSVPLRSEKGWQKPKQFTQVHFGMGACVLCARCCRSLFVLLRAIDSAPEYDGSNIM